MPSPLARKSTKENQLKPEDADMNDDHKLTTTGRPVRRTAGKRALDSNYVNSTDAIRDTLGDMIEETKNLFTNKNTKKRVSTALRKIRSPTPPPLRTVDCPDASVFSTMENSPAPEITAATAFEPINLTFNIPLGFHGPLKIQLDGDILSRLATPSPLSHNFPTPPRANKRARIFDEHLPVHKKASRSKKIDRFIRKHGHAPRGFCDLPPGKSAP
jgi:hypothetical protein